MKGSHFKVAPVQLQTSLEALKDGVKEGQGDEAKSFPPLDSFSLSPTLSVARGHNIVSPLPFERSPMTTQQGASFLTLWGSQSLLCHPDSSDRSFYGILR